MLGEKYVKELIREKQRELKMLEKNTIKRV